MSSDASAAARSLRPDALAGHVFDELLPLWAEHGFDAVHGGFHNRLEPSLRPAGDGYKRLVVHARQVYCFAWGARETGNSLFFERAEQGFAFLHDHFLDQRHGGWFLTTAPDGAPLDRSKDAYAHAFVLLALAEFARATGNRAALDTARETLALLDHKLADPRHGGLREAAAEDWGTLAKPVPRRQNPHMHLFEALLALHDASGEPGYVDRAAALADLLCSRWIDAERGCLHEYFSDDWRPDASVEAGAVEPGHHFEWYWLLHCHAGLRARPALVRAAAGLWAFASRHGVDPVSGGVFDAVLPDGSIQRDSKRLWPQTEHLKALCTRIEHHHCPHAARELPAALRLCFDRYVDPATRGWREHAARDGRIHSTHMNASSVYHVITALLEAARVLRAGTPDPADAGS